MSRRATLRIALSLAALLLLGGCFRLPKSLRFPSSTKKKVADPRKYRFPDLPVPGGLELSVEDSFIFEAPGTRAGNLVYRGERKYESVVRFFREKMPEHGWKLVSSFERSVRSRVGATGILPGKIRWAQGTILPPARP